MDRGRPGSKTHVLPDANGLPLVVGVSAANVHDSEGLKPMVAGHQTGHDPHRGRYFKPERLHTDKAYDVPHLRKWLRGKRIGVRIARRGVESGERSGRRRRVIERTMPLQRRQPQGRCSDAGHGAGRLRCSSQVPPVTVPVTNKPTISDFLNSSTLLPSSAMTTDSAVMTTVITNPMARFFLTRDFSNCSSFSMGAAPHRPRCGAAPGCHPFGSVSTVLRRVRYGRCRPPPSDGASCFSCFS